MPKELGETVDVSTHQCNGVPRWWTQYVDGSQIDMVVLSAQSRTGRTPGSIALLDRSGRLNSIFVPSVLKSAAGEPREWFMDGLEALGNVAKCIQSKTIARLLSRQHCSVRRSPQRNCSGMHATHADPDLESALLHHVTQRLQGVTLGGL